MQVHLITDPTGRQAAYRIRTQVFVEEQGVPAAAELDEFEDSAVHFWATDAQGQALGTARWRFTDHGIKLERFAVCPAARGQGVGQALVQAVLANIAAHPASQARPRYLHAQVAAMPLYLKFGFVAQGEPFAECGIWHYEMVQKMP
ncbi:MAG: GNAT family N-acetyltransferase [Bernardetiaceae bacterium]|jgi:predicted GNAT family N-acyltransferase|nr:GNAT family N-acetyltransferase [Bernardetiaceae bacterium]